MTARQHRNFTLSEIEQGEDEGSFRPVKNGRIRGNSIFDCEDDQDDSNLQSNSGEGNQNHVTATPLREAQHVAASNNTSRNSFVRHNMSAASLSSLSKSKRSKQNRQDSKKETSDEPNDTSDSFNTENGVSRDFKGRERVFGGWLQRIRPGFMRNDHQNPPEEDRHKASVMCAPESAMRVGHVETKVIHVLRVAMLCLLMVTATLVSVGVYFYTKNQETQRFETDFETHATRIMETFHQAVARRLGAIDSLATSMTSYALATNQTFPFVTMPDFAIRGSDLRIQADAMVIHYMPLVTDDTREKWENYSFAQRSHIDVAFEVDAAMREWQDQDFGYSDVEDDLPPNENDDRFKNGPRELEDDKSGYRPRIWSNGPFTPKGDEAYGSGPFLPLWQRSPINGAKQKLLNWNFAGTPVFHGVLEALLSSQQAIMNKASRALTEAGRTNLRANLAISQFRHNIEDYVDDPLTFLAYPVWNSFDRDTQEIGGVLATNIHWKILFQRILPPSAHSIVCILKNSYNQTLAYLVDGEEATFLAEEDTHDTRYEHMEQSANINSYLESLAGPETRSYTTVPLSEKYGKYTLHVYPTRETEESYETNNPWIYTTVVACVFFFTSLVFVIFTWVVDRRQHLLMNASLENARKAADTERELNEFLSHEVRNPLAAAMSACSFVYSAVAGEPQNNVSTAEFKKLLLDDVKVIETSLRFVNDFLRSMVDMHRAQVDQVDFELAPAYVKRDVLDPVCRMLYQRNFTFVVERDCPQDLVIMTDRMRLKQVLLNLGVNASKFVTTGFVRFRASVVAGHVEIYVEDSGPGIPKEKRANMFNKSENYLNEMGQGTGIGLGLSKSLIKSLDGDIWLDEKYQSGMQDLPGARFVIQLNHAPVSPGSLPIYSSDKTSVATKEDAATGNDAEQRVAEQVIDEPIEAKDLPENLSVLFVDDDLILRKLFARALKKVAPSWNIEQAPDGMTALEIVESKSDNFDIIFMDQYMPSSREKTLLGTETVEILRSNGFKNRICGLSANELETEFLEAGADYFHVKPLPGDSAELKAWLRQILG